MSALLPNHSHTVFHFTTHTLFVGSSPLEREREERVRERGMIREKEALVVCGDKKLGVGMTIWDMETGDHLLHIPTCASPFHGLTCLRNQYFVASQIHRPGSVGGGIIFTWPFNKPRAPLRSYSVEGIGPLSSTKDGIYLAGGATSGNVYIWEVIDGRLLKTWHAHNSSLTCLVFSDDGSLLISGSEDGMIVVWPMISLLDETKSGAFPLILSFSTDHKSFITGLLSTSNRSNSVFVSSSLDGTCKVWDLVRGTLIQTCSFPQPITAIVLDPAERILFSGSADGRIFMKPFDIGLVEDPSVDSEDQKVVLNGHKESITALAFSRSGLVSASEDCTACLWDVAKRVIIRRFNHQKGFITNMVVIPQSSLIPLRSHQRVSNHFRVSLLDKYPQPANPSKGIVTLLSSLHSPEEQKITPQYRSADLLNQQILDLEVGRTAEAIQLKLETSIESRMWVTRMAKNVMSMNKHLQSRVLDVAQHRLLQKHGENEGLSLGKRRKKLHNTCIS